MLGAFAGSDHGADRDAHRLSSGKQARGLLRTALGERDRRKVFEDAAGTPPVAQIVMDLKTVAQQRRSDRIATVGRQQAQLLKRPRYALTESDSLRQRAALLQELGRLRAG